MSAVRPPAVLVKGDDAILVAQATGAAIEAALGDADPAFALEDLTGDERGPGAVAEAAATPPFLAEHRVVVLREAGRFNTAELAPLIAYLADPAPTATVVIAAGGGALPAPLSKAVQKAKGEVVDAGVPRGKSRTTWIAGRVKDGPVQLDAAATKLVETHLGDDLGRLQPLLEVLAAAYGDGAKIGPAALEPFLGETGGGAPWDLTDAIDKGDVPTALAQLHRTMGAAAGRHPLIVAASLRNHFSRIARLDGAGVTNDADAAELLGIAAYPAKKALTQSRRLGSDALLRALTLLADADVDLKGRSSWPPELVLEVLVARLARLTKTRSR